METITAIINKIKMDSFTGMMSIASQFHLMNRSIPSQSLKADETAKLLLVLRISDQQGNAADQPRQLLVDTFWGNFGLCRLGPPEIIRQTDNIILLQVGAHLNLNDTERLIRYIF